MSAESMLDAAQQFHRQCAGLEVTARHTLHDLNALARSADLLRRDWPSDSFAAFDEAREHAKALLAALERVRGQEPPPVPVPNRTQDALTRKLLAFADRRKVAEAEGKGKGVAS